MRKYAKHWRDSASLIVAARNPGGDRSHDGFNYKVLVFKRTEKTSFLPNHIVFPGGAFDPQDDSREWVTFCTERQVPPTDLHSLTTAVSGPRPYIFQTTSADQLDRNISVRLCALRECFEELGVLLVADRRNRTGYSVAKGGFDVRPWQTDVHDGRRQFRELYGELGEIPDLWGLYEWSTWITPTMFKKRFETAFFLAALNEVPDVYPEKHEVEECMWQTPRDLIAAHCEGNLWLAPPQAYELHRLSHVHDIDDLVQFARARNRKGITSFCPLGYNASDGYIGVLPGDDLYPANYDFISVNEDANKYVDLTMDQLADRAVNLHRVEHRGLYSQTYLHNGPPLDDHLHVLGKNRGLSKL